MPNAHQQRYGESASIALRDLVLHHGVDRELRFLCAAVVLVVLVADPVCRQRQDGDEHDAADDDDDHHPRVVCSAQEHTVSAWAGMQSARGRGKAYAICA